MSNSLTVEFGQPVDLMARIVDSTDAPLVQSDVTTITYTVFSVDSETEVETGVTSYTNIGLVITDTIVNTLSISGWDEDATGWNFRHTVPAAALASNDQNYHVVYTFTVQGNDSVAEFFLLTYESEGADLDATWGGDASDSYITWAEANSFIKTHILDNAAWTSATIEKQKAALLQAAIDIDSQHYAGDSYFSTQSRSFPRAVCGTSSTSETSATFMTHMQSDVEKAACYQALWLLIQNSKSSHSQMASQGVKEVERVVGPLREHYVYNQGAVNNQVELSSYARRILSKYMGSRQILRA